CRIYRDKRLIDKLIIFGVRGTNATLGPSSSGGIAPNLWFLKHVLFESTSEHALDSLVGRPPSDQVRGRLSPENALRGRGVWRAPDTVPRRCGLTHRGVDFIGPRPSERTVPAAPFPCRVDISRISRISAMSRRCDLTSKGAQVGHKVSHSNIK